MKLKNFIFLCGIVALCMTSCTTITKTATSMDVESALNSNSEADLDVQNSRISFTYFPTASIRRGGTLNVKAAAVAEALKANGNGDVLVEPQFEIRVSKNLFGIKKIKSVIVTGYPAKYKNFRY